MIRPGYSLDKNIDTQIFNMSLTHSYWVAQGESTDSAESDLLNETYGGISPVQGQTQGYHLHTMIANN